jgi:purine-cytosine permease-like protein
MAAAGPTFARRVFLIAGIYGIAVLAPQYFVELGLPALIERPEHFYGFIGVALAWQVAFLIIASDVVRYRPLMLAGVLEKLSFGGAVAILYAVDRVSVGVLLAGTLDLILGALFVAAYTTTRPWVNPG